MKNSNISPAFLDIKYNVTLNSTILEGNKSNYPKTIERNKI